MKSFVLLFILLFSVAGAKSQLIEGVEYFWDTDPGIGNGTYLPFDEADDEINTALEFDATGLTSGRHRLFLRSKRSDGTYGQPNGRIIYIPRQLVTAEYFWDIDPGQGNGFPLHLQYNGNTVEMCDHVSTSDLTEGNHYLFVRTKSSDGVWSIPNRTTVTITANEIANGCPGDFDYNGSINSTDLLAFLSYLGTEGDCQYDLTDDLLVNTADILILIGAFGYDCP